MDRIICVVGPTASGKTALAVELAKQFNGEVLSCDSMQIYKGMDIGTAKPTAEEMQGIPHYMIDFLSPNEDYSVGRYVEEADRILQEILSRGKTAVIAGGTGLYVDSLIAGRSFAPAPVTGNREKLRKMAEEKGIGSVLEFLYTVDPQRAEKLSPADEKRIIRAAEIWLDTGKTATEHDAETKAVPPKYQPLWIGLNYVNRQDLYDRINRRVRKMVEEGLLDEVRALLGSGIRPDATAMQAIGYKEFLAVCNGAEPIEEAIERVSQGTRRYAKRQLSWFRRNNEIHWINLPADPDIRAMTAEAVKIAEEHFLPEITEGMKNGRNS